MRTPVGAAGSSAWGRRTPGGRGSGSKRSSPRRSEPSPVRTDAGKLDELLRKMGELNTTMQSFGQRLDGVERREAERVAAEGDAYARETRKHARGGRRGDLDDEESGYDSDGGRSYRPTCRTA